ncbi:MAG: hypothetical protein LUF33_08430 [Clostridiales bacterium]|nr:hypothetical protein [Clostridiales bacterium]
MFNAFISSPAVLSQLPFVGRYFTFPSFSILYVSVTYPTLSSASKRASRYVIISPTGFQLSGSANFIPSLALQQPS